MTKYPATLEWNAVKNLGAAFDLDTLKGGSGFYEVDTPTNGPGAGVYMVQVMKSGVNGHVVQKAWLKSDGTENVRVFTGSVWSGWDAVSAGTVGTVGVAATGSTASESGNDALHHTHLVVDTTMPAIAGGANLAIGKLLYTLPDDCDVHIHMARMSLALTAEDGNIDADTPDGGLGTTIGAGVQALLSGVGAAAENILTGQTFNDCNGTAETAYTNAQFLFIADGGDKTVYFNLADGWAASGEAALPVAGTVDLWWSRVAV